MSKNKIAVIGYGYWGKNHARVLGELGCLSGVYDPLISDNTNSDIKFFHNIDDVVSNSTAAIISTPATTHFEIAKSVISELDLLIEKPMAMSVEECVELESLSMSNNKIIMVGHQLHFHPAIQEIKNIINKGILGKTKYIYSNRLNMGKIRTKENVLWSFAPHDISLILEIVNSDVTSINIQGSNIINKNVEDATLTNFTFKNGINAHIFVSWFHPFKEQRFVVIGDKGTIVFTDSVENNKLVLYQTEINSKGLEISNHDSQVISYKNSEPLKNQAIYFIEAINTRHCEINNASHGRKVIEVLEKSTELL